MYYTPSVFSEELPFHFLLHVVIHNDGDHWLPRWARRRALKQTASSYEDS